MVAYFFWVWYFVVFVYGVIWKYITLVSKIKTPWYLYIWLCSKNSLKIPKRLLEAVSRRRTDNIMANRKSTKDKQRSTKHCTENKRLPNTNSTKTKDCPTRPHQNKRLPNTNLTKTKQQLKKTKDCPTRTPPKQNNNWRKQKIAQHEPHQNKTTIKEN